MDLGTDVRTDEELVAAANAGVAGAFEALYLRYRDWAVSLALRFTHDRHLAFDVLQEAFLYLWGKFPGLVLTAKLTTLLYPAVRNLSIQARRKARGNAGDSSLDGIPAPEPESPSSRSDLAEILKSLPADARETLILRFVDGLSLAEIAAALGIPVGTVKSRLHNAVAAIRADVRTRVYFEGE
ncbi:MAG: sigma-70 family RNA polymerase sigma factor [Planctomycetota bacterium]